MARSRNWDGSPESPKDKAKVIGKGRDLRIVKVN